MRVIIQKYDVSVKEPPFTFITLSDVIELPKSIDEDYKRDTSGTFLYRVFNELCYKHKQTLKFYSGSSDPEIDYKLCVYGEVEEQECRKLWPRKMYEPSL